MASEADDVRMGTLPRITRQLEPVTDSKKLERPAAPAWRRIAAYSLAALLLVFAALWGVSALFPDALAPVGEEVGLLRFQDGTAPADQVTISTSNMAPPPEGSQYEAWLIQDDGEQRISIGVIEFDEQNKGALTFLDREGRNLIAKFRSLEITREPDPDPSTNSSHEVAFSASLPAEGLKHVRHLVFSFDATPQKIGFIHGLEADTILLDELAGQILTSFETRDEAGIRLQAEAMLNLIVGSQSESYRDWNNDGRVDDPGDGYGLLLNGENLGYIQGSFTHADLALQSPDATQNMRTHGEHVKICTTNLGEWTPQLRDQLTAILGTPADSPDLEGMIRKTVALADKIRNGIDVNGNEHVEPVAGEGGAVTAYEHAYYMADMVIVPTP